MCGNGESESLPPIKCDNKLRDKATFGGGGGCKKSQCVCRSTRRISSGSGLEMGSSFLGEGAAALAGTLEAP